MGSSASKEVQTRRQPQDARIVILGAGPAGVSAAYYLMNEKGYTNVTVIEKNPHIGGKCHSYEEDGKYIEMGAVEVTQDYKNVLQILAELKMDDNFVNMLDVVEATLDRTTGKIKPYEAYVRDAATKDGELLDTLGLEDLAVVSAAIGYLDHIHKYKDWLEQAGNHNCPEDLAMPFMDYLKKHELDAIARLFVAPITLFGYGALESICAGYAMKYMNHGNFITIMQRAAATVARAALNKIHIRWKPKKRLPARLPLGYQSFVTGMGKQLTEQKKCQIITNTITTHIDRKEGVITLTTKTGDAEPVKRQFDHIIFAFPQRTETMSKMMTLSPAEKEVFDKVHIINYHTICLKDTADPAKQERKFPAGAQCSILDDDKPIANMLDGKPTLVYAREDTPLAVVYSLSDETKFAHPQFEKEANDMLIKRLGYKFDETPRCSINWEYFPHFKSEDFVEKNNQLYALQGQWNTYFTGGLLCFENVERAVQYSHFLVQKFF